jgi:uncharacterized protein YlaI
MEQVLGRPLKHEEWVHHKDGNTLNNKIDNLIIISQEEHKRLHNTVIKEHICQWCKKTFYRHTNRPRKFCSLSCASRYGHSL